MIPKEFSKIYNRNLARMKKGSGPFVIFREPLFERGVHPENFIDYECSFAAHRIRQAKPQKILDVGSYRHFILGLLANFPVTTIDLRRRKPISENEVVLTCDAKKLDLPDHSFDLVVSLCALEHFGLGRYGDEFDLEADKKAFGEMIRVLKPGGRLIFTTTITGAQPAIAFNAHRIYNYRMLKAFCAGLTCLEEKFYSHKAKGFCPLEEITTEPKWWDVYMGCWEKGKREKGKRDRAEGKFLLWPGKYYFSPSEYQMARIEYEKNWKIRPSQFDRILVSLSSEFKTNEEIREAESMIEEKIEKFNEPYQYAIS